MKKKAILGGTFDPFHNGHLSIAYESLYRLNLDELIFMPAGNPPHKRKKLITPSQLRIQMLEASIKGEKRFRVSDYEIKKEGYSFTYETLNYFKAKEEDTTLYFLTGVDCLMELDSWRNVEEILRTANFVVFNRPGYSREEILKQKDKIERQYDCDIIFLDIPLLDISSTEIRGKVKKHEEIKYLVPREVYDIIKDNKLYI